MLLRTERRGERDQQHHDDNKHLDGLVRRFSDVCDSDAHTMAPGRKCRNQVITLTTYYKWCDGDVTIVIPVEG